MPLLWKKIRSWFRDHFHDSMRQQITRSGLAFIATIVLVGLAAFGSGNNLLFLLFAALLATFLISGLISRLGLAGLEFDLKVPPHIAARRPVSARIVIRNRKWLIPSFSLHLSGAEGSGLHQEFYVPVLPGNAVLEERIDLSFAKRGLYKDNTFFFASRFPFGFTERRAQVRLTDEVLIYPSIDPSGATASQIDDIMDGIESRLRGIGNDFYRIRPYVFLESARHVDWRATAHTGDLQVREYAREENEIITLFLDLYVPKDGDDWFERAVEACAQLAWRLAEKGIRMRFLAQRFDRRVPEEATVYDILRFLALTEPTGDPPVPPPDDRNLQIVFSARPEKILDLGFHRARIVGVSDLPGPDLSGDRQGSGKSPGGAGPHVDHGSGTHRGGSTGVHHHSADTADSSAARSQHR